MRAITPQAELPFRPASILEVMANDTRKKMLEHLRLNGKQEVIQLADQLEISNLKLQHHLSMLQQLGLVRLVSNQQKTYAKFRAIGWHRMKKQWAAAKVDRLAFAVVR